MIKRLAFCSILSLIMAFPAYALESQFVISSVCTTTTEDGDYRKPCLVDNDMSYTLEYDSGTEMVIQVVAEPNVLDRILVSAKKGRTYAEAKDRLPVKARERIAQHGTGSIKIQGQVIARAIPPALVYRVARWAGEMGELFQIPNAWAAIDVYDTFTEASQTNLASHTADIGSTWDEMATDGDQKVNASDYLEQTATTATKRSQNDSTVGVDVIITSDVKGKNTVVTGGLAIGVIARMIDNATTDHYECRYSDNDATSAEDWDLQLDERVASTSTTIASINFGGTNGTSYSMQCVITSGRKEMCINNLASCVTATENAVDAGSIKVGIVTLTGQATTEMDNFRATTYTRGQSIN